MTSRLQIERFWRVGRLLLAGLLLAGIILSGRFAHFWDASWFAFVFGGGLALFLMGFSLPQLGAAVRYLGGRSPDNAEAALLPYLWEALGRNFWVVGVLGSFASFVLSLARTSEGIQQVAFLLVASFLPALYGMFLTVVCAVPALKSREDLNRLEQSAPAAIGSSDRHPWTLVNAAGYLLLIAILGWTIVLPATRGYLQERRLLSFFFDPAALLVVGGGTVVMMVFLGKTLWGTSLTGALAIVGLLGSLMGLMQTLFAFTKKSISDVASALAFIITCCFVALLGIILAGLPLADHEGRSAGRPRGIGFHRLAWYLFPLLALFFLIVTFIAVVTPLKM